MRIASLLMRSQWMMPCPDKADDESVCQLCCMMRLALAFTPTSKRRRQFVGSTGCDHSLPDRRHATTLRLPERRYRILSLRSNRSPPGTVTFGKLSSVLKLYNTGAHDATTIRADNNTTTRGVRQLSYSLSHDVTPGEITA
ncbi:hypothetical protein BIW11_06055 [Tropilaelaps mercedesae]|uniref:Uncharacterized protein n=1 Tax=Tropilaelaps mercedesae TaxID=418985 RepID=A0A1V9XZT7_9ACAR|nr:hypothetical protein BIW11_06055 [Tropilaelaps mercedesae]